MDLRDAGQLLFNLLILGLGPFVGSLLGDRFRTPGGEVDFGRLFLVPAWLGVAALVVLLLGFRPGTPRTTA